MKQLIPLFIFILTSFYFNTLFSQDFITGNIIDLKGNPIPYVNIVTDWTRISTTGTASGYDGRFRIRSNQAQFLYFSCIGYRSTEMSVEDFKKNRVIVLEEDSYELETVVVVARSTKTTSRGGCIYGYPRRDSFLNVDLDYGLRQWKVYPNPTPGPFSLNTTGKIGGSLEVISSNGMLVRSFLFETLPKSFDISSLNAGAYYLRYREKDWVGTIGKVVKIE